MAGEIERAVQALNARKEAILDGDQTGLAGDDEFIALLSGFDLDPAEILAKAEEAAAHGVRGMVVALRAGASPTMMLSSLWLDGLAMDLLVAEHRAREQAE